MNKTLLDRYDLKRFIDAQTDSFESALLELQAGEKRGHWMWYIFPQIAGLGTSIMSQFYAINSVEEAKAYLSHPILGQRIKVCAEALLSVEGRTIDQIMGSVDSLKLLSSMTLFACISLQGSVFSRVLTKYYSGNEDEKTKSFILSEYRIELD